MVQEICRDIKKLDYAKKHLTNVITALRRLGMLGAHRISPSRLCCWPMLSATAGLRSVRCGCAGWPGLQASVQRGRPHFGGTQPACRVPLRARASGSGGATKSEGIVELASSERRQ